jgi:hypothetical protein
MAEIKPGCPFGYTVFCDDIRHEIGGKQTIVGAFSENLLIFGEPPFSLPKMGFFITYSESRTAPKLPLALQIYLPEDVEDRPTHSFELPTMPDDVQIDPMLPPDTNIALRIPLVISPIEIRQEGLLRVRMKRGDDVVCIGSLPVRSVRNMPVDEVSEVVDKFPDA